MSMMSNKRSLIPRDKGDKSHVITPQKEVAALQTSGNSLNDLGN